MDVPEIDVDELADLHAGGGALVIDVREPDEYADGHVTGAVLMPMADLVERIDEVPTDASVYVICATGRRSARATQFFRSNGIDAANVAGGMRAWEATGRPVERGGGA